MLQSSIGVTWPSWWWDSTNSKLTATLLVTLIGVLWLLWRFKSSINTSTLPSPLPPGPVGLPLVGYLPFLILGTHLHLKFDKLARVYGPIFKLMLGTKTFVVVSSPSLVKEIVRDQDTIFANRDPPIALLLSLYGGDDIASLPYGPQWKKARPHMVWGESEILQGEEGAAIGVEFRALVSELMVLIGKPNISDVYPALAWLDLQGIESKTRKVSQWIDRLFDSVIEKRMNVTENRDTKSEKKDFLQYLLQVELENSDSHSASMTMNEIKALLIVEQNLQAVSLGIGFPCTNCVSNFLLEKMVMFMLASFLHSFEWRLPSGTVLELSGEVGIVIKKMKPLIAIPKPRLSKPELYQ
ncbi:Cytochrome P450 [Sesbania bispinosa]|nr:Cytochrome P450 [Sesbania bispinosa]